MTPNLLNLIAAAKDLLESVSFDENGTLIGGKWVGGNGGLISAKTHQKADSLRRAIDRAQKENDNGQA